MHAKAKRTKQIRTKMERGEGFVQLEDMHVNMYEMIAQKICHFIIPCLPANLTKAVLG